MAHARPQFIVIGAGRSGTTALHNALAAHPGIALCPKSPNVFAAADPAPAWETPAALSMMRHWVHDGADYRALFAALPDDAVVGEASPVYLQTVHAAGRIADAAPDVRLVAILRDPAERALSHWAGRRRDGIDTTSSFAECVERELADPLPDDVAFGHYVGIGRYHHFLRPFLDRFPASSLQVHLHDDLVTDPARVLRSIVEHIGVEPSEEHLAVPTGRNNASGRIESPLKRRVWESTVRLRTALRPYLSESLRNRVGDAVLTDVARPRLEPELRERIIAALRTDIEALQDTIDRDLSAWLH